MQSRSGFAVRVTITTQLSGSNNESRKYMSLNKNMFIWCCKVVEKWSILNIIFISKPTSFQATVLKVSLFRKNSVALTSIEAEWNVQEQKFNLLFNKMHNIENSQFSHEMCASVQANKYNNISKKKDF